LLTCQQCVSVAAHDTLNVAGRDVEKETFGHGCVARGLFDRVALLQSSPALGEFVDVRRAAFPHAKPRR
jgi:hypothetical protein